ncbi:glyoxylate succinic semialdehyde reductase chloroplastic [Raphidocelis subcapitata]|uniref:Glyoxylate succinic semialdehyde reductase chloroplastic n=1 Tax=Raphidocelis subcapitata TaxID=307507 RepID=A0A2V0P0X5_9CHLO|nr:glyoxylate succinic semialdehyde reductase chloroplastic [Raphidocelis subcapitata]|eukprot:GBF93518.1 glyoxylate succinic semialdehyde reductase chloroplastic [Raphidocelis subcapitata]
MVSVTRPAAARPAGQIAAAAPGPRPVAGARRTPPQPPRAAAVPTAEPGSTTLGFIGIGIMGLAMANNLLKAGYKVVVWNRNPAKCEPLRAAGAQVASSAAEAAATADITFAMLSDPEAALAVAQDVAKGLRPGKGYVDVSTVDAATSAAVSKLAAAAGASFLEAPVSGSKGPAEAGQLIFLCAGDRPLFDAAAGPLDVMGKRAFYLGPVGAGAHMKLVVNMVMGSMMAAFAEGLALSDQLGLSQQDMLEVMSLGAINAPMFALKGPAMIKGSYPPAFPLKHQQKDLRLALAAADARGQPLAVAAAANDLYIRAKGAGRGDEDFSAVLAAVLQQQQQGQQ